MLIYVNLVYTCFHSASKSRNGNIVIAIVPKRTRHGNCREPKVCLVTSIWRSARKPKLCTSALGLPHVLAYKAVELSKTTDDDQSNRWTCCGKSATLVLRPEATMALLDFETVQDSDESLVVAFSSKAVELIESMDDLASQWPQEELDLRMNVVLPRQGRKRKAKDTSKGGQGKGGASTDDTNAKKNPESALVEKTDKTETEEKEAKGKSKKSKSGKKKRKHLLAKIKKKAIKLKPAPAEKPEIDFTAENLMKNSASDDLIQKELLKLKIAEAKAFKSNPLFSEKDLCRITSKGTEGTPWKHIKTFAYKYFKAEYLGCTWILQTF